MLSDTDPSPEPLHPLQSALDGLERVVSSSEEEGPEKGDDGMRRAVEGLRRWLKKLISEPDVSLDAAHSFASFARDDLFKYRHPTSAVSKAALALSKDDSKNDEEGEVGEDMKDGKQLKAVLKAVKAVLERCVERALEGDKANAQRGKVWEEILVGVVEGVKRHLARDPIKGSKWTPDQHAYRALLSSVLSPTLFHVYLPNPAGIPPSSAREIDDGGGEAGGIVPPEAKYVALELLGELLSKHEENKGKLRELVPPSHLGRVLANSLDCHLSRLTLELAYRLTPGRPRVTANATSRSSPTVDQHALKRKAFIDGLFSKEWNGLCAEELRKSYDAITSANWQEETVRLLHRISDKRIDRSQRFAALSLRYNNQSLLPTHLDEAEEDSYEAPATPPTLATLASGGPGSYEPANVWICRNFIGATIESEALREEYGVESDGASEDGEERMLVQLDGVERVFVQDLGPQLDLLRITFLVRSSSPLLLNRRAHPSSASHVGRALKSAEESQVSEALPAMHKLEMVVREASINLGLLKKVLEDRRKVSWTLVHISSLFHVPPTTGGAYVRDHVVLQRYPNIGKELHNFPHRVPVVKPPSSKSLSNLPAKSVADASAPAHIGTISTKPRPTAALNGKVGKSVAFASPPVEARNSSRVHPLQSPTAAMMAIEEKEKKPAPIVPRAPRKSSEAIEPVEQVFPASRSVPASSAAPIHEQPLPAATAAPVAATGQSQSQSQSLSQREREEVVAQSAKLNELVDEVAPEEKPGAAKQIEEEGEDMDVEQDLSRAAEVDQDFGGGFEQDDGETEQGVAAPRGSPDAAVGAEDDSLPSPSQIGRRVTVPTSEGPRAASVTSGAHITPAGPSKAKDDAAPPAIAGKQVRPRASTIGKPRPAEEEEITPSQRAALGRKESQLQGAQEKGNGKRAEKAGLARLVSTLSSDLSELGSEDGDEKVKRQGVMVKLGEGGGKGERLEEKVFDHDPLAQVNQVRPSLRPAASTRTATSKHVDKLIAPVAGSKQGSMLDAVAAAVTSNELNGDQPKHRRSPRLSGSSSSEAEPTTAKQAPPPKKTTAALPPPPKRVKVSRGLEERGEKATTTSGRPRRAAATAAKQKVVAGLKRSRAQQESAAEDGNDEGQEEEMLMQESDAVAKRQKKAPAPAKKVVKAGAAIPSGRGKKRKLSHTPSASDASKVQDDGHESETTDYETYPAPPWPNTLEEERKDVSPRRRYGKEKAPIKPAGGKRKAGQASKKAVEVEKSTGKKPGVRRRKGRESKEPQEATKHNELGEEETTARRMTRAQTKPKTKKVVKGGEVASTSGIEDIEDMRPSPFAELSPKPKDKRVSEDIAPPFELNRSPRKSASRAPATDDRSTSAKEKTPQQQKHIQTFSQLVAETQADHYADLDGLGGFAVERSGEIRDETGDLGGFDMHFPDHDDYELPLADAPLFETGAHKSSAADPFCLEGARQAERLAAKDLSLTRAFSSMLNTANGTTFVDSLEAPARTCAAETFDQESAPVQADPQPQILVEDTMSDGESAAANGKHDSAKTRQEDDEVVMFDSEQKKKEQDDEAIDSNDLVSPTGEVGDSDAKFNERLDKGAGAGEQEMARIGRALVASAAEQVSGDHVAQDAALAPRSAASNLRKPVSAPPSSSQIRPLLVEKPVRPPRSAESKLAHISRPVGPALHIQPVASTSKAQLPATAALAGTKSQAAGRAPHNPKGVLAASTVSAAGATRQAPEQKTRFALPPAQQQDVLRPPAAKLAQPVLRSSRSRPSIATHAANAFAATSKKAQLIPSSIPFPSLPFAVRRQLYSKHAPSGAHFTFGARPAPKSNKQTGFTPMQHVQTVPRAKVQAKRQDKGKGKERVQVAEQPHGDDISAGHEEDWDEDDKELYIVLDRLTKVIVNKHREKRATRQAHHQHSVNRLDRQLANYLADVHEQTCALLAVHPSEDPTDPVSFLDVDPIRENILTAACSYSSALTSASSPDSRLMQLLKRSRDVNSRLWLEAESELSALAEGTQ
ncbi:hypothetical protein JCM11251_002853 [Rhodosporidiobolus azoricus]